MKTKTGKFVVMLLVLALGLALMAQTALASSVASGEIPVKISLTGTPPATDELYTVVMKAGSPTFPMPEGSTDGLYKMTIRGAGTGTLPKIEFSSVGVYRYEIWQEKGQNTLASYDTTKYVLHIYVTVSEEGEGFDVAVLLYEDGKTVKLDEVGFVNHYTRGWEDETPPEPPKTPDPDPDPKPVPDPDPDPKDEIEVKPEPPQVKPDEKEDDEKELIVPPEPPKAEPDEKPKWPTLPLPRTGAAAIWPLSIAGFFLLGLGALTRRKK